MFCCVITAFSQQNMTAKLAKINPGFLTLAQKQSKNRPVTGGNQSI
jgi:hypothetical protein